MPLIQSPTTPRNSKLNRHNERQPGTTMQESGYGMVAANDLVVLQNLQDNTKQHYYEHKHTSLGCVADLPEPPKSLNFLRPERAQYSSPDAFSEDQSKECLDAKL
ncbi:hypothetical protein Bca4012_017989 [Brassica carinata]|uniref:Uncharacterized protein n=1 Tax=Brassica carinata TaxID=52824 RepID=A0A8X8BEW8_BRACI|nr:hypothetical protein Bca52824_003605 [Brassica carinata]